MLHAAVYNYAWSQDVLQESGKMWQKLAETETVAVEPCVCYFSFLSLCISLLLCKFVLQKEFSEIQLRFSNH